jgi:hypothetical protein
MEDSGLNPKAMTRWVNRLRNLPRGKAPIPTMGAPRGRRAPLEDPRTWRDYATMRKALTVFAGYGPGFMVLPEDRPEELAPAPAALSPECGEVTLFMATPLPADGLAAWDEREQAARARAHQQARTRRMLAVGHRGAISPQRRPMPRSRRARQGARTG